MFDLVVLVQAVLGGVILGAIYALLGTSFALIYNTTRVFNVAHGAVFAVAPYAYIAVRSKDVPQYVAVAMAVAFAAAVGAIIEHFIFWPLNARKSAPLSGLLSSLGIYIVIVNSIVLLFGNQTITLTNEIPKVLRFGSLVLSLLQLLQLTVAVVLLGLLWLVVSYTSLGRLLRAIRDDSVLALVVGIHLPGVRALTYAIASGLAATAALLLSFDGGVHPHVGLQAVLAAAVAVAIGGAGSFYGAAVGGFILGMARNLTAASVSSEWSEASTFVLLLVFLLLRPNGIVASYRRPEETSA